jgi:hypothetical protein
MEAAASHKILDNQGGGTRFAFDTPGVLYRCERKGVAEKGICKTVKTKD